MNKLKEMLIRKGLNFKVANVAENKVEVRFETPLKMKAEYNEYLYLLDEVPAIIKGIENVVVDIRTQKGVIRYNNTILDMKDIENLLLDIKEFIIEEWDFISDSKDEDVKKIISVLKNKFKDRIFKK
ncbi:MAG: hypothetical protein ACRCWM_07960 [Sarcina sp.]